MLLLHAGGPDHTEESCCRAVSYPAIWPKHNILIHRVNLPLLKFKLRWCSVWSTLKHFAKHFVVECKKRSPILSWAWNRMRPLVSWMQVECPVRLICTHKVPFGITDRCHESYLTPERDLCQPWLLPLAFIMVFLHVSLTLILTLNQRVSLPDAKRHLRPLDEKNTDSKQGMRTGRHSVTSYKCRM